MGGVELMGAAVVGCSSSVSSGTADGAAADDDGEDDVVDGDGGGGSPRRGRLLGRLSRNVRPRFMTATIELEMVNERPRSTELEILAMCDDRLGGLARSEV